MLSQYEENIGKLLNHHLKRKFCDVSVTQYVTAYLATEIQLKFILY